MAKAEDKFCLLDTNVLVYAINVESEHHDLSRKRLESLREMGYRFCLTEQIVREFLVVVTHPRLVARPLDPHAAKLLATRLLYQFVFLPSNNYSRLCLLELVDRYRLKGRSIHDANIVAVMVAHGVKDLLTYNRKDFTSYREITLMK